VLKASMAQKDGQHPQWSLLGWPCFDMQGKF